MDESDRLQGLKVAIGVSDAIEQAKQRCAAARGPVAIANARRAYAQALVDALAYYRPLIEGLMDYYEHLDEEFKGVAAQLDGRDAAQEVERCIN